MRSRHITKTTRLENLFLTELVSDITLRKWRVNRDQTNNRFNFYWLLTRRLTWSCFWRLQLISFLSGFHASFYDNIHIRFKMIFQRFLCSLCHIFFKFIIIFQLVLRRIYRVALEIVGEKLYISQLPGLQYKKEISLTSTGHACSALFHPLHGCLHLPSFRTFLITFR